MSNTRKIRNAIEWLLEEITYDNGHGQRLGSFKEEVDLTPYFEKAKEIESYRLTQRFEEGRELGQIEILAQQSTSNASSYADGYTEGYKRALQLVQEKVNEKIKELKG